ncbi:MAG: DNA adenine methylase [Myxococcota bacterium]
MRPLLKWAGGKARLAQSIGEAFQDPCKGVYYEPFCGAGSVFLYRRSKGQIDGAVLSDINPKLVAVHTAVRDTLDLLLEELDRLPQEDWRERYYEVRESYNEGPHEGPAHAARFIWLNRAGFNGLYRENRKGGFNVPIGRYDRLSFPEESHFRQVSELLQGVEIRTSTFEPILKRARKGDQVYCDPPYVPLSTTASFVGYHKSAFNQTHQLALAREAQRAAHEGAVVVLSNHDLPVVRTEIYPKDAGFVYVARPEVSRSISRKGAGRQRVGEVIARIGPLPRVA